MFSETPARVVAVPLLLVFRRLGFLVLLVAALVHLRDWSGGASLPWLRHALGTVAPSLAAPWTLVWVVAVMGGLGGVPGRSGWPRGRLEAVTERWAHPALDLPFRRLAALLRLLGCPFGLLQS